jgi:hypothetical protein
MKEYLFLKSKLTKRANELNSPNTIDDAIEKHRQQMDEIIRTIKEKREQKHQHEHSSNE